MEKKGFYFLGHKTILCEWLDLVWPLTPFIIIIFVIMCLCCGVSELYEYCKSEYYDIQRIKQEKILLEKQKQFLLEKENNFNYLSSIDFPSYFNDINFSLYGVSYIQNNNSDNEKLYNIIKDGLYYGNINKNIYQIYDNDNFSVIINNNKLFFNKNEKGIKKISFKEEYISYSKLQMIYDDIINNNFTEISNTIEDDNNEFVKTYKHKFKKENVLITLSYTSYINKAFIKIDTEKIS